MDVRFGLIGYGGWGSHHASAIAQARGAQLVAIASRSGDACERARAQYPDARAYDDLFDLLADDAVDVVDVVLPSALHFPVAQLALEANKHVLVERPLALSVDECDRLIALAAARDRILAVAHTMRLSSLWARIKLLIDQGTIGEPRAAWFDLWRLPYREGVGQWRYDPQFVGNWLLEGPIQLFDLARWCLAALGEPESVFARANSLEPGHDGLEYNFTAQIDFPRGAWAAVSQTVCGFEHHQSVRVTGTDGALWGTWSGNIDLTRSPRESLRRFHRNRLEEVELDCPTSDILALRELVYNVSNAVRDGYAPIASGTDGRWAVALCEASRRSITTGLPVVLSPPELP